ncbi:MAG TPA: 2-phosphosulfolactate phosphatase [Acidimicrobiales bacterium]|jgi:2-phosphosulfolactate phosphatase|nr:2-phosphosulfolactate phosphatase [Acidimicrobiales bacterium]
MIADHPRVVVDWLPERAEAYARGWAVVAVDVFRATTTACTAVAMGRRCFPVGSRDAALARAGQLDRPLLAGEVAGKVVDGFELGNSPVTVAAHQDRHRPLVLLSSSGTKLLAAARGADVVFAASLRNVTAQVEDLVELGMPVAVLGAGTRGELRMEDLLGCARIAAGLVGRGYRADFRTAQMASHWGEAPISLCATGRSARWLRDAGQDQDIGFVLDHDDDLSETFTMVDDELVGRTR